jgi:hypothetical protein
MKALIWLGEYFTLTAVGEGHHAGGGACAFRVLDDADVLAFEDGDAGIGGTKIDTDDFAHVCSFQRTALARSTDAVPQRLIRIDVWDRPGRNKGNS